MWSCQQIRLYKSTRCPEIVTLFRGNGWNRETTVLLGDLYSVCMKLVQSEIQGSREKIRDIRDSSRSIFRGFNNWIANQTRFVTKQRLRYQTLKTLYAIVTVTFRVLQNLITLSIVTYMSHIYVAFTCFGQLMTIFRRQILRKLLLHKT
jgi:hypothetical protein